MFWLVALVQFCRTILGSAESFLDTAHLPDPYERIPRQPGCFCLRSSLHNHMCRDDFGTCSLCDMTLLFWLSYLLYFLIYCDILLHIKLILWPLPRSFSTSCPFHEWSDLWEQLCGRLIFQTTNHLDCHIIALLRSSWSFELIRELINLRIWFSFNIHVLYNILCTYCDLWIRLAMVYWFILFQPNVFMVLRTGYVLKPGVIFHYFRLFCNFFAYGEYKT